jgi:hypothetical protein
MRVLWYGEDRLSQGRREAALGSLSFTPLPITASQAA